MGLSFEERLENYRAQWPWRRDVTARQGRRLRQRAWARGELRRERPFRAEEG